eukprot:10394282-Alexandrium_andersonii.AAC.1
MHPSGALGINFEAVSGPRSSSFEWGGNGVPQFVGSAWVVGSALWDPADPAHVGTWSPWAARQVGT